MKHWIASLNEQECARGWRDPWGLGALVASWGSRAGPSSLQLAASWGRIAPRAWRGSHRDWTRSVNQWQGRNNSMFPTCHTTALKTRSSLILLPKRYRRKPELAPTWPTERLQSWSSSYTRVGRTNPFACLFLPWGSSMSPKGMVENKPLGCHLSLA